MHDVATLPRGRRARAERRRAEKAERRRLEAAEAAAADVTTATVTADPTADPTTGALTVDTRVVDALDADRDSDGGDHGQPDLARRGFVASIQRGGELTVLIGASAVNARLSRELLQQQVSLAVGDRVQVARGADGRDAVVDIDARRTRLARIREDRSRRSGFEREEAVLAANVDVAVIVAAVAQPAFHPKLVDRFLVVCQYGGIQPVLCLNKCDLVESPPDVTIYEHLGLPIIYASAATGTGLDELRRLLRGTVAVFTGHSGVGKSSLVNALLGDEKQVVGAVRGADGRGRHTTTWSTLLHWDDDSFVVDTPGVRSLGIWKIDPATLGWYFPDFDAFSPHCRFSRCSHTHEPDCAVKEAVATGEVPRQRYESYVRMMDG